MGDATAFRIAILGMAALLLGGEGKPSGEQDLATIKAARSIIAEWALINQFDAAGKLSDTFAQGMRKEARRQLSAALHKLANQKSPAAQEIARTSQAPAGADAAALKASVQRLLTIETQLEHR